MGRVLPSIVLKAAVLAVAVNVVAAIGDRAWSDELPTVTTPTIGSPQELPAVVSEQPFDTVVTQEPEWGPSPCQTSVWKFTAEYAWATLEGAQRDMGSGLEFSIATEDSEGFGKRGVLWLFHQQEHGYYGGQFDVSRERFCFDYYRRRTSNLGELSLGGGPATAFASHFYSGGGSIFGQGYYQLLGTERTGFGAIGSARLAILAGVYDGPKHLEVGWNSFGVIDEFGWGVELRRRIGERCDRYWSVNVERDIQGWANIDLPYVSRDIQSTAVNFGTVW